MSDEHTITINGRQLAFTPGETILEVARRNDIFIPTLCHLPGARPTGACRMCVVEVERARTLIASCAMPAAPRMVVRTETPAVHEARRSMLELLLASGHHNCSVRRTRPERWTGLQRETAAYDQSEELCPVYGECKLQAFAYRYQADSSKFAGRVSDYPPEMASPLIVRDFSRCILCGRCVQACNEIQVNNAIAHGFRGTRSKIVALGDSDLSRSECVFCGECIQACPVGALVEAKSRYQVRPWEARHVRTTCHYCSVGCQLDLHVKDGRVMKVTGIPETAPNLGRLCMQGRFGFDFLTSPRRLTQPQVRENGALRPATWDEALDRVAARLQEVRAADGPQALVAICSAKESNETLFLAQKMWRAVLGSPQVIAPGAAVPMSASLADLERAEKILLIDSDVTVENPVAGTFIKRATQRGARLVVIDDRPTRIAGFAEVALQARPKTQTILLQGLFRQLLENGPARGFEKARQVAEAFPPEEVAARTGVTRESLEAARALLQSEGPTMLVYGPRGADAVALYDEIQAYLGNRQPASGGVQALSELNNAVGALLMGAHPAYLPGYQPVGDAAARARWEEAWGASLPGEAGTTLSAWLAAAAGGNGGSPPRLLFVLGEDLTVSAPTREGLQAAVAAGAGLVYIGAFENETAAERAEVVLPAAIWAETEGTTINCERRVQRVAPAVPAAGEARPATWILRELAQRLGADWPERDSAAIWEEEIRPHVPQLGEIAFRDLAAGGRTWELPPAEEAAETTVESIALPRIKPEAEPTLLHHRRLLEHCPGLLDSLPQEAGGTRAWPTDPAEITQAFETFLADEDQPEKRAEIDAILARYREQRGGLIPVLQQVQGAIGFLPVPVQNYIALGLGVPAASVFGVTSFYSFFTMVPRGKYTIRVCLGTACYVKGSGKILENLEQHLGIKVGETTPDRQFTLTGVRCVGACGLAPVVVVGEDTHGRLDPARAAKILDGYRSAP